MTKELKQKAKKWVKENTHTEPSAIFGEITVYPSAEKGYIAGATEATKALKEENADLKEEVNKIAFARGSLEKENAELKAFKEKCKFNVSDIFKDIETENNLTKAKELLNEFMRISKASDEDFEHDYSELIVEAENFLKESEVEK